MEERMMTVYRGSTKDYEPVPKITIQGKWLEKMGFSIGDRLLVVCEENGLTISKVGNDLEVQKNRISRDK